MPEWLWDRIGSWKTSINFMDKCSISDNYPVGNFIEGRVVDGLQLIGQKVVL